MDDRKQPTPPPITSTPHMSATYTAAFEAWENEFCGNPGAFLTEAECAAMDVLPLSEQRTVCFEAILRRLASA